MTGNHPWQSSPGEILMRRLTLACVVTAALVVAGPGPSDGQQPPPPGGPPGPQIYNPFSAPVQQPPAQTQASSLATVPSQRTQVPIMNPTYPNAPGGGYGGYGGATFVNQGAYGGYLNGAANLTVANAQYQLTNQQARIVREQANQEQLQTRQMTRREQQNEYDDWIKRYDPTTVRIQDQEWWLRRAVNNPPRVEIWSGQALNPILFDIQKCQMAGLQAPPVPIDPAILPHLNLTDGTTREGAGMIKNLARFDWPLSLRQPDYDDGRQKIEQLTKDAVQQAAQSSGVNAGLLDNLRQTVKDMQNQLDAAAPGMTPDAYVSAARFMRELAQSLRILQDPDVSKYFRGQWRAQGSTVGELVSFMGSQGLRFASAVTGDQPYYTTLHLNMVDYDYRLHMSGGQR
jgi:hypothetical protein